jgi:hypothetical protein
VLAAIDGKPNVVDVYVNLLPIGVTVPFPGFTRVISEAASEVTAGVFLLESVGAIVKVLVIVLECGKYLLEICYKTG